MLASELMPRWRNCKTFKEGDTQTHHSATISCSSLWPSYQPGLERRRLCLTPSAAKSWLTLRNVATVRRGEEVQRNSARFGKVTGNRRDKQRPKGGQRGKGEEQSREELGKKAGTELSRKKRQQEGKDRDRRQVGR